MKFNVDGKAFQQSLQAVSKVINSKNTISILDNFLLVVEGNRLSITGSDSENELTNYITVYESDSDGSVAVNARRLLEITKEIDNQPLTFEINDETKEIKIYYLTGHFDFMGVSGEDYPRRRAPQEDHQILLLPTQMVSSGINNTIYAVSPEMTRPIMTGIYWDIHENDITFVSSDTHKLVKYVNTEKAPGINSSFILPSKAANILKNLIGKDDADIKITFDAKGGVFEFGDFMLSTVFITGRYPDYNRVIPAENPFVLTVDRLSLINALRRVTLFASKASNLVALDIRDNQIVLHAQDLDYSTQAEEQVACSYEGNDMVVGFNGVFMIEILSNISDESILMQLSDPARPCLYSPLTMKEGEELVTIQMPMQVI